MKIKMQLEDMKDNLESSVGTGRENIDALAEQIIDLLKKLEDDLNSGLKSVVLADVKKLKSNIDKICDIINGDYIEDKSVDKEKNKGKIVKLNAKLLKLEKEQNLFLDNKNRLEEELKNCLSKENDLNDKLMSTDDDILSSMIFRDIKANKKNIGFIQSRCQNYNACFH